MLEARPSWSALLPRAGVAPRGLPQALEHLNLPGVIRVVLRNADDELAAGPQFPTRRPGPEPAWGKPQYDGRQACVLLTDETDILRPRGIVR